MCLCELFGSLRVLSLRQISITIGLAPSLSPPTDPPTQNTRSSYPLWNRPLKIDETPVDCRDLYLELYIAIYLLFDSLHLLVTYLFT